VRRRTNAAVIGAFVIGAVVLVGFAVVLWGSGRLFRDTAKYVCYFEGSVEGLEVGAPVKVRGVPVGRVTHIQLRYRQDPTDNRIPVFIELDRKRLVGLGVERPNPQVLAQVISQGLRARLEPQSFVTGILFVNFGFFPRSPVQYFEIDPQHGIPEIPTVPRPFAEVGDSVTAIVSKLERIDFGAMVEAITGAASSFDRLASSEQVPQLLGQATSTLKAYERVGRDVHTDLHPLLTDLRLTVGDTRKAIVGMGGAADATSRLVAPEAPLSIRLGEALDQVSRAANAVHDLAEYLERNPNALILGNGKAKGQ
jgi:paraquat-inducible protein B